MPLTAIGSAVIAVAGSAYGARNGDYLSRAHKFGAKFGLALGTTITLILVIFATFGIRNHNYINPCYICNSSSYNICIYSRNCKSGSRDCTIPSAGLSMPDFNRNRDTFKLLLSGNR